MSNTDRLILTSLLASLIGCVLALIVFYGETYDDRAKLRKEAVERGHAEWVLDSEGNTEWRWKGGSDE